MARVRPDRLPLYESLFVSSLAVADGHVSLPSDPGLGVELGDVLDEYRVG